MSKKDNKKQIAKISVFITSIFVILMSVTYALMSEVVTGEKQVVINAGVLDLVLEEENEITISDALPMYDEVGMIQDDVFVFRLVNKTANPTNYVLKLEEIETGTLDKSGVKYGLIKEGESTIDFVSNISDEVIDSGTIAGNDTLDYELRLWIDSSVTDITKVQNKFLSLRVSVEASQEIETAYVENTSDIVKKNLGTGCKTYNDGTDTFLVGQCSNNYVWYSGKLWRAVLKNNETGAVKMITDNAITNISYNEAYNSTFENSYIDQWLQQEFLPTLHDYEDYLITDSVWNATIISTSSSTRPTYDTSVIRTVGLLNRYEYYTTYGKSDGLATYSANYLNNRIYWWLMTPSNSSNVYIVQSSGSNTGYRSFADVGVRPVVNFKSTIKILSGTGKQTDPYILESDLQEPTNGTTLLNTRYSGEYVTFNNELYRIVDIENGLTKITAVDKPTALSDSQFHNVNGVTSFAEADIKTVLENYYKSLSSNAYYMIQPNMTWYLGELDQTDTYYKMTICATVDSDVSMSDCTDKATSTTASIGLPRIGEMFTSQITRGTKAAFWTLTPNIWDGGLSLVVSIISPSYGSADYPTNIFQIHPSMYLKSNVVIASNNTGNGTYEYPYSIELGS